MSLEVYPQSGPPGPIGPTASVLFSAGTLSSVRSDITFNNSNGVTFGLDGGGVITATVQTNYQSAGAYLTTAALSQDSSKYAGTTSGMTGGSLTVDTAGVAISLPAYLTTAQPPGAYLTTAMASNRGSDFVQATAGFFGTNASGTIASDGISVSVNAGGGSLNISAGSTSSNVSAVTFSNGSGVTFGFDGSNVTASVQTNYQTPGAYLTTAALSQDSSKYAGTNGSVETTSGTDLALTLNTSGATIAYPKWLTTAQPPGAYLTTAALSQDSSKYAGTGFTTTTTAGTNVVGTLNTSGLSLGVPVYLTTAALSGGTSDFLKITANLSDVSVVSLGRSNLGFDYLPNYLRRTKEYSSANDILAVTTWVTRKDSVDNDWHSICWSPELGLFCAVSFGAGSLDRVMTSPDGINWTTRNQSTDALWGGVCWSPDLGLFCAVGDDGAGNGLVMTSPDGVNWTFQTSAADGNWESVCWSAELGLFCAVGDSASSHQVMTSPNGTAWTRHDASSNSSWFSVCWSKELGIFCAFSTGGTENTMTSTDGTNWTPRTSIAHAKSVCWASEVNLFVAVGNDGSGHRVQTSPDGVNWTNQTGTAALTWLSVAWSPDLGLFCAVASNGITTSPDGVNWTARTSPASNNWQCVCWSPELNIFCAAAGSGTGNRVMTSKVVDLVISRLDTQGIGISNVGNTAGTTGMATGLPLQLVFAGGNSITLSQSLSAGSATITISAGNYLTTAALSQNTSNYAGTNTSLLTTTGTDLKVTLNTTGLTVAYPKWLTAASGAGAGTGFTTATTAGTAVVGTLDSNGLSMGVPAYLTTAALSANTSNYAGTNTSLQTTSGTDLKVTLNTTGLTIAYPAWLTTASAGGAGTGFTTATTAGTAVVGTLDSNGLSMGVPAYLTTAMASNAATISNIKVSAGTLSNNLSAVTFSDSNGVSWGLNTNSVITATVKTDYQSSGAYLTTAALSQDSSKYAGTNTSVATTAGTDLTLGVNTSGVTIGYPKWITTYVNDLTSQRAGTNTSVQTTSGTDLSCALNTSGLTIAYPAWLTTAAATNITSARAGTNTSVATTSGTDLSFALNTSGETIAYPKWITTWTPGIVGVSNSQTVFTTGTVAFSEGGGAITIASSAGGQSLMFSVPQTSSLVGTNGISISTTGSTISVSNIGPNISAGTTSTNQSNYTFSNANGISFGIGTGASVGVITASIATSLSVVNFSAAGSSNNLGSVVFSNSNGVSFGLNGSTITANAGTNAGTNTAVSTTAGSDITLGVNTSGVTIGYPKWLTTAAQSSALASYWCNLQEVQGTSSFSLQSNSVNVQPFMLPYPISMSYVRVPVSFANLTSTTVAATAGSTSFYYYQSINAVLYSQGAGANSRSLQYLTSSQAAFTEAFLFSISNAGTNESIAYQITYPVEGNNTANSATTMLTTAGGASIFLHTTGGMTNFTGIHHLDIPMAISLSAGNYWIAFNRSTNSTTSGGGINITGNINRAHTFIVCTQINSNFVPLGFASGGAATASTQPVWQIGLGSHSVSAQGATTASLALSSVSSVANFPVIPMQFIRQA